MTNTSFKTIWQSPSNIALIKYWGKHGNQLPNNASLSMTLKHAVTTTKMEYRKSDSGLKVTYIFEGERNNQFEEKVLNFLVSLKSEMTFLATSDLYFESRNSFPHSTGIASSASSMSALSLCLVALSESVVGANIANENKIICTSHIARLGSGSASRSLYGGWVSWGKSEVLTDSSDEFASPVSFNIHSKFQEMGDAVLIISSKNKRVSSTLGHKLMHVHPFAEARYKQASANLTILKQAMQNGNFEEFAHVAETEALTLHSLLMTSAENGLLLKPNTLAVIERIREFRLATGTELCFTLDAGPNVHLLYPKDERDKVLHFIQNELIHFCEDQKWIDDEIGMGPQELTVF